MANIRVAVRVRPLSQKEEVCGGRHVVGIKDKIISITDIKVPSPWEGGADHRERVRHFVFDHAYFHEGSLQAAQNPESSSSSPVHHRKKMRGSSLPNVHLRKASSLAATQKKNQKERSNDYDIKVRGGGEDTIDRPEVSDQEMVYRELGEEMESAAVSGYNSCILAYGQSGSGKTYTILGQKDAPGLAPRICQGLLNRLFTRYDPDDMCANDFSLTLSLIEIYNERVRDLLTDSEPGRLLRVREHPNTGPYVDGVTRHAITDAREAWSLLERGRASRSVAATASHAYSSRSHALLILDITQPAAHTRSTLTLVDLAGSERAGEDGDRTRLTEGASINRSLVTLGNVISALAEYGGGVGSTRASPMGSSLSLNTSVASYASYAHSSSNAHLNTHVVAADSSVPSDVGRRTSRLPFIPYRDSVLTWLLKDSLGGNAKTLMIATISPSSTSYSESIATLRYATRARCIVNVPVVNLDSGAATIRSLQKEVASLKRLLCKASPSAMHSLGTRGTALLDFVSKTSPSDLTREWIDSLHQEEEKDGHIEKDLKRLRRRSAPPGSGGGSSCIATKVSLNRSTSSLQGTEAIQSSAGPRDIIVESESPYLLNTLSDAHASNIIIYHIENGASVVGSGKKSDLHLSGLDVASSHFTLTHARGVVTLRCLAGCEVKVNSEAVREGGTRRLSNGDLLTIGSRHFTYHAPTRSQPRSRSCPRRQVRVEEEESRSNSAAECDDEEDPDSTQDSRTRSLHHKATQYNHPAAFRKTGCTKQSSSFERVGDKGMGQSQTHFEEQEGLNKEHRSCTSSEEEKEKEERSYRDSGCQVKPTEIDCHQSDLDQKRNFRSTWSDVRKVCGESVSENETMSGVTVKPPPIAERRSPLGASQSEGNICQRGTDLTDVEDESGAKSHYCLHESYFFGSNNSLDSSVSQPSCASLDSRLTHVSGSSNTYHSKLLPRDFFLDLKEGRGCASATSTPLVSPQSPSETRRHWDCSIWPEVERGLRRNQSVPDIRSVKSIDEKRHFKKGCLQSPRLQIATADDREKRQKIIDAVTQRLYPGSGPGFRRHPRKNLEKPQTPGERECSCKKKAVKTDVITPISKGSESGTPRQSRRFQCGVPLSPRVQSDIALTYQTSSLKGISGSHLPLPVYSDTASSEKSFSVSQLGVTSCSQIPQRINKPTAKREVKASVATESKSTMNSSQRSEQTADCKKCSPDLCATDDVEGDERSRTVPVVPRDDEDNFVRNSSPPENQLQRQTGHSEPDSLSDVVGAAGGGENREKEKREKVGDEGAGGGQERERRKIPLTPALFQLQRVLASLNDPEKFSDDSLELPGLDIDSLSPSTSRLSPPIVDEDEISVGNISKDSLEDVTICNFTSQQQTGTSVKASSTSVPLCFSDIPANYFTKRAPPLKEKKDSFIQAFFHPVSVPDMVDSLEIEEDYPSVSDDSSDIVKNSKSNSFNLHDSPNLPRLRANIASQLTTTVAGLSTNSLALPRIGRKSTRERAEKRFLDSTSSEESDTDSRRRPRFRKRRGKKSLPLISMDTFEQEDRSDSTEYLSFRQSSAEKDGMFDMDNDRVNNNTNTNPQDNGGILQRGQRVEAFSLYGKASTTNCVKMKEAKLKNIHVKYEKETPEPPQSSEREFPLAFIPPRCHMMQQLDLKSQKGKESKLEENVGKHTDTQIVLKESARKLLLAVNKDGLLSETSREAVADLLQASSQQLANCSLDTFESLDSSLGILRSESVTTQDEDYDTAHGEDTWQESSGESQTPTMKYSASKFSDYKNHSTPQNNSPQVQKRSADKQEQMHMTEGEVSLSDINLDITEHHMTIGVHLDNEEYSATASDGCSTEGSWEEVDMENYQKNQEINLSKKQMQVIANEFTPRTARRLLYTIIECSENSRSEGLPSESDVIPSDWQESFSESGEEFGSEQIFDDMSENLMSSSDETMLDTVRQNQDDLQDSLSCVSNDILGDSKAMKSANSTVEDTLESTKSYSGSLESLSNLPLSPDITEIKEVSGDLSDDRDSSELLTRDQKHIENLSIASSHQEYYTKFQGATFDDDQNIVFSSNSKPARDSIPDCIPSLDLSSVAMCQYSPFMGRIEVFDHENEHNKLDDSKHCNQTRQELISTSDLVATSSQESPTISEDLNHKSMSILSHTVCRVGQHISGKYCHQDIGSQSLVKENNLPTPSQNASDLYSQFRKASLRNTNSENISYEDNACSAAVDNFKLRFESGEITEIVVQDSLPLLHHITTANPHVLSKHTPITPPNSVLKTFDHETIASLKPQCDTRKATSKTSVLQESFMNDTKSLHSTQSSNSISQELTPNHSSLENNSINSADDITQDDGVGDIIDSRISYPEMKNSVIPIHESFPLVNKTVFQRMTPLTPQNSFVEQSTTYRPLPVTPQNSLAERTTIQEIGLPVLPTEENSMQRGTFPLAHKSIAERRGVQNLPPLSRDLIAEGNAFLLINPLSILPKGKAVHDCPSLTPQNSLARENGIPEIIHPTQVTVKSPFENSITLTSQNLQAEGIAFQDVNSLSSMAIETAIQEISEGQSTQINVSTIIQAKEDAVHRNSTCESQYSTTDVCAIQRVNALSLQDEEHFYQESASLRLQTSLAEGTATHNTSPLVQMAEGSVSQQINPIALHHTICKGTKSQGTCSLPIQVEGSPLLRSRPWSMSSFSRETPLTPQNSLAEVNTIQKNNSEEPLTEDSAFKRTTILSQQNSVVEGNAIQVTNYSTPLREGNVVQRCSLLTPQNSVSEKISIQGTNYVRPLSEGKLLQSFSSAPKNSVSERNTIHIASSLTPETEGSAIQRGSHLIPESSFSERNTAQETISLTPLRERSTIQRSIQLTPQNSLVDESLMERSNLLIPLPQGRSVSRIPSEKGHISLEESNAPEKVLCATSQNLLIARSSEQRILPLTLHNSLAEGDAQGITTLKSQNSITEGCSIQEIAPPLPNIVIAEGTIQSDSLVTSQHSLDQATAVKGIHPVTPCSLVETKTTQRIPLLVPQNLLVERNTSPIITPQTLQRTPEAIVQINPSGSQQCSSTESSSQQFPSLAPQNSVVEGTVPQKIPQVTSSTIQRNPPITPQNSIIEESISISEIPPLTPQNSVTDGYAIHFSRPPIPQNSLKERDPSRTITSKPHNSFEDAETNEDVPMMSEIPVMTDKSSVHHDSPEDYVSGMFEAAVHLRNSDSLKSSPLVKAIIGHKPLAQMSPSNSSRVSAVATSASTSLQNDNASSAALKASSQKSLESTTNLREYGTIFRPQNSLKSGIYSIAVTSLANTISSPSSSSFAGGSTSSSQISAGDAAQESGAQSLRNMFNVVPSSHQSDICLPKYDLTSSISTPKAAPIVSNKSSNAYAGEIKHQTSLEISSQVKSVNISSGVDISQLTPSLSHQLSLDGGPAHQEGLSHQISLSTAIFPELSSTTPPEIPPTASHKTISVETNIPDDTSLNLHEHLPQTTYLSALSLNTQGSIPQVRERHLPHSLDTDTVFSQNTLDYEGSIDSLQQCSTASLNAPQTVSSLLVKNVSESTYSMAVEQYLGLSYLSGTDIADTQISSQDDSADTNLSKLSSDLTKKDMENAIRLKTERQSAKEVSGKIASIKAMPSTSESASENPNKPADNQISCDILKYYVDRESFSTNTLGNAPQSAVGKDIDFLQSQNISQNNSIPSNVPATIQGNENLPSSHQIEYTSEEVYKAEIALKYPWNSVHDKAVARETGDVSNSSGTHPVVQQYHQETTTFTREINKRASDLVRSQSDDDSHFKTSLEDYDDSKVEVDDKEKSDEDSEEVSLAEDALLCETPAVVLNIPGPSLPGSMDNLCSMKEHRTALKNRSDMKKMVLQEDLPNSSLQKDMNSAANFGVNSSNDTKVKSLHHVDYLSIVKEKQHRDSLHESNRTVPKENANFHLSDVIPCIIIGKESKNITLQEPSSGLQEMSSSSLFCSEKDIINEEFHGMQEMVQSDRPAANELIDTKLCMTTETFLSQDLGPSSSLLSREVTNKKDLHREFAREASPSLPTGSPFHQLSGASENMTKFGYKRIVRQITSTEDGIPCVEDPEVSTPHLQVSDKLNEHKEKKIVKSSSLPNAETKKKHEQLTAIHDKVLTIDVPSQHDLARMKRSAFSKKNLMRLNKPNLNDPLYQDPRMSMKERPDSLPKRDISMESNSPLAHCLEEECAASDYCQNLNQRRSSLQFPTEKTRMEPSDMKNRSSGGLQSQKRYEDKLFTEERNADFHLGIPSVGKSHETHTGEKYNTKGNFILWNERSDPHKGASGTAVKEKQISDISVLRKDSEVHELEHLGESFKVANVELTVSDYSEPSATEDQNHPSLEIAETKKPEKNLSQLSPVSTQREQKYIEKLTSTSWHGSFLMEHDRSEDDWGASDESITFIFMTPEDENEDPTNKTVLNDDLCTQGFSNYRSSSNLSQIGLTIGMPSDTQQIHSYDLYKTNCRHLIRTTSLDSICYVLHRIHVDGIKAELQRTSSLEDMTQEFATLLERGRVFSSTDLTTENLLETEPTSSGNYESEIIADDTRKCVDSCDDKEKKVNKNIIQSPACMLNIQAANHSPLEDDVFLKSPSPILTYGQASWGDWKSMILGHSASPPSVRRMFKTSKSSPQLHQRSTTENLKKKSVSWSDLQGCGSLETEVSELNEVKKNEKPILQVRSIMKKPSLAPITSTPPPTTPPFSPPQLPPPVCSVDHLAHIIQAKGTRKENEDDDDDDSEDTGDGDEDGDGDDDDDGDDDSDNDDDIPLPRSNLRELFSLQLPLHIKERAFRSLSPSNEKQQTSVINTSPAERDVHSNDHQPLKMDKEVNLLESRRHFKDSAASSSISMAKCASGTIGDDDIQVVTSDKKTSNYMMQDTTKFRCLSSDKAEFHSDLCNLLESSSQMHDNLKRLSSSSSYSMSEPSVPTATSDANLSSSDSSQISSSPVSDSTTYGTLGFQSGTGNPPNLLRIHGFLNEGLCSLPTSTTSNSVNVLPDIPAHASALSAPTTPSEADLSPVTPKAPRYRSEGDLTMNNNECLSNTWVTLSKVMQEAGTILKTLSETSLVLHHQITNPDQRGVLPPLLEENSLNSFSSENKKVASVAVQTDKSQKLKFNMRSAIAQTSFESSSDTENVDNYARSSYLQSKTSSHKSSHRKYESESRNRAMSVLKELNQLRREREQMSSVINQCNSSTLNVPQNVPNRLHGNKSSSSDLDSSLSSLMASLQNLTQIRRQEADIESYSDLNITSQRYLAMYQQRLQESCLQLEERLRLSAIKRKLRSHILSNSHNHFHTDPAKMALHASLDFAKSPFCGRTESSNTTSYLSAAASLPTIGPPQSPVHSRRDIQPCCCISPTHQLDHSHLCSTVRACSAHTHRSFCHSTPTPETSYSPHCMTARARTSSQQCRDQLLHLRKQLVSASGLASSSSSLGDSSPPGRSSSHRLKGLGNIFDTPYQRDHAASLSSLPVRTNSHRLWKSSSNTAGSTASVASESETDRLRWPHHCFDSDSDSGAGWSSSGLSLRHAYH